MSPRFNNHSDDNYMYDSRDDFDDEIDDMGDEEEAPPPPPKNGIFSGLVREPINPRDRYAGEDEPSLFAPGRKPEIDGKGRYNPELLQEKVPGLPQNYRTKFRKRNKKPMKFWMKASLTGASLFACFVALVGFLAVQAAMMQINSAGDLIDDIELTAEQLQELEDARDEEGEDEVDEWQMPETPVRSDKDIELILLLGSDGRGKKGEIPRSDSIKLVAIDKKHNKLKIVSIQRDLYCKIPGYKDWKFNSAFYYDMKNKNADLAIMKKTLLTYLRIKVDKFVIVDFSGFKELVNIVDGIDVEVTAGEAKYMCSDPNYGIFPEYKKGAGVYHMDGIQALNYARARKISEKDENGQDGDFARANRQNVVIKKLIEKVKTLSVTQLGQLGIAALDLIITDMSQGELLGYVTDAPVIMGYKQVNFTVPVNGSWLYDHDEAGQSVIRTNFNFNAQELHKFIYEDDMTYSDPKVKAEGVIVPKVPSAAKPLEGEEEEAS